MGKRKINIALIENKASRTVTFTKRRHGLFKKAGELCTLCNAEIAIITFSPAGKPFAFGHPGIESLISRYGFDLPTAIASSKATILNPDCHLQAHVHDSSKGTTTGSWWEVVNVDDCVDEGDLHRLKRALEGLRENVYARLNELSRVISGPLDLTCVKSDENDSTLHCLPGGVSSSFPGTTLDCLGLCGDLSEHMQGLFGGQSPDSEIFDSLPQPGDISFRL